MFPKAVDSRSNAARDGRGGAGASGRRAPGGGLTAAELDAKLTNPSTVCGLFSSYIHLLILNRSDTIQVISACFTTGMR